MNKSTILIWILIIVLILIAIGVGLYFWKRSKDISDMKSQLYNIEKKSMSNCKDLKSMTDCIVDNMIKNFGYLHAKELFDGDKKYTDQENSEQQTLTKKCMSQFCGT